MLEETRIQFPCFLSAKRNKSQDGSILMVHFPLLSNCPAESQSFFPTFVSPNIRVSSFSTRYLKRIIEKKKRILAHAHAKAMHTKVGRERGGRKRENNRGIFNVRKINERATLCKLWQGLITWRRAVIRSTCFPEFSVKNLDVV